MIAMAKREALLQCDIVWMNGMQLYRYISVELYDTYLLPLNCKVDHQFAIACSCWKIYDTLSRI